MDTQGRELSKAQQEYFKDSKVRDENGGLPKFSREFVSKQMSEQDNLLEKASYRRH